MLALRTDVPELAAALHARLRAFSADGTRPSELAFDFSFVERVEDHPLERPRSPARPVYEPPFGEVVYTDADDLFYIDLDGRVRVSCDPARGRARISALEEERESLWLLSHPMFTLPLVELLKRRGLYSVHAAGFSVGGRALLLAGGTGSGKSTLTIALLRTGLGFLSDDMVFLRPSRDGLEVLAFPDEIDVTDETAAFFPELHHLVDRPKRPGWPKHPIWADELYGAEAVPSCRPGVVVLAGIGRRQESVLEPVGRTEALLELTPNVLLTDARSSQAHLDALAELVEESECYRLTAGRDLDSLPGLLGGLAGRLAEA